MPMLDVSWVTRDPMLADSFDVFRRRDLVDTNGRTAPTVVETFPGVVGVVTQQSPGDLMRREEGQIVPRRIFIAACFKFYGASRETGWALPEDFQPDLVEWNGTTYVVTEVMSYGRYGRGVWEVVAESMSAVDVPQ